MQAIPTYTMSCFKLLVGLCNEIESLIRKSWWGQKGDRRKVHWLSGKLFANQNLLEVWALKT